mgnify:CR=1 FL=1
MNKLIIILGPTASGKTALAVKIADQYNGEIISADSRQVYKGMDIGTGKDLYEYNINGNKIQYHLIDILEPNIDYSVFNFKENFNSAYNNIKSRNKVPILCGGTALYIDSILYDYKIPHSKPNLELRRQLEQLSQKDLIIKLTNIKNNIYDQQYHISKRRLIRSIEILNSNATIDMNLQGENKLNNSLVLGIQIDREILLKRIKLRLEQRLQQGMIEEVEMLIKRGISRERLVSLGLEYRYISKYLSNILDYDTMKEKLNIAINQFSKRQMTFFRRIEKRGTRIHWIKHDSIEDYKILVDKYLS